MEKRGSECCPIDLTDDDDDEPPCLEQGREREIDQVTLINERISDIEVKLESAQCVDYRVNLVCASDLNSACFELENRLDTLESSLQKLAEAFCQKEEILNETVSEERNNSPIYVGNAATCGDLLTKGSRFDENQNDDSSESICVSGEPVSQAKEPSSLVSHENLDESVRVSVPSPSVTHTDHPVDRGRGENEEIDMNPNDDIKPQVRWIKMPQLPSLKQEVELMRDDMGRILMFLCSSAKRITKSSSTVGAVAGMYLNDIMHNEFYFESERTMKDVKVEAEIRAALFGVEVVKSLFKGSLDNVCVMVISRCGVLVSQMKMDRIYPNFYSCSCLRHDCEHAEFRWHSQELLGKSQIDVLPELMLSKQFLKVHWCKSGENTSEEEDQVMSRYQNDVEATLELYLREAKRTHF